MADYVSIANLAASKLGEDDQLRSPEDDTHLGRTVAAVWDLVRQAALRDHSWNFAMKRAALPKSAAAAPFPWRSSFPLPADNLRLVEVLDLQARSAYQIEGRAILCNSDGPVHIRYITDVAEPALWDQLFVEAFACRLAFQISDRITGDSNRKQAAWAEYQAALAQAKRVDARENPQVAWEAGSWETARLGVDECRVSPGTGTIWP
jgi:hypothetical protein